MPTKKNLAQKIFVLDTNVILNNANSIFHYPNAEIIIPLCVINKLDVVCEPKIMRAANNASPK